MSACCPTVRCPRSLTPCPVSSTNNNGHKDRLFIQLRTSSQQRGKGKHVNCTALGVSAWSRSKYVGDPTGLASHMSWLMTHFPLSNLFLPVVGTGSRIGHFPQLHVKSLFTLGEKIREKARNRPRPGENAAAGQPHKRAIIRLHCTAARKMGLPGMMSTKVLDFLTPSPLVRTWN